MKRYGEVDHIPAGVQVAAGGRRLGDRVAAAAVYARLLIPGTAKGHGLKWEPKRGWVIRPASGLRRLTWLPPVASTKAYGPEDSDGAAGWSAEILGIA
ncbi:hypothetical protein [Nocardia tengchongensis]|uniref:hypothetical protein n=1 Tax=Nocardia tengchongensis TaxID=2055889 RepID=UPI0036A20293